MNLLDTQIGSVEAGLGVAVIPSFGVLAAGVGTPLLGAREESVRARLRARLL